MCEGGVVYTMGAHNAVTGCVNSELIECVTVRAAGTSKVAAGCTARRVNVPAPGAASASDLCVGLRPPEARLLTGSGSSTHSPRPAAPRRPGYRGDQRDVTEPVAM
ncbi:hypothetical protein chiPu_0007081 [Chiloscyllium punctatum]|uniref:Uncharacterized protein n=1 Tax=Chiloscyllium punctatum TaxID=137246 RepID=A0A401SE21_CHIPU|nr:hypothetical protein [Chiloscyllium punctatum]